MGKFFIKPLNRTTYDMVLARILELGYVYSNSMFKTVEDVHKRFANLETHYPVIGLDSSRGHADSYRAHVGFQGYDKVEFEFFWTEHAKINKAPVIVTLAPALIASVTPEEIKIGSVAFPTSVLASLVQARDSFK